MWWLIVRQPHPDAHVWPGRRLWAFIDALVWPTAVVVAAGRVPSSGLVGQVIVAGAMLFALRGGWRALFANERYRFATLRLAVPLIAFIAAGALIKALA